MNLPMKITMFRLVLTVIIVLILIFPVHLINFAWPLYQINGFGNFILVDLRYLIAAGLFLIAAFTDYLDGYFARKHNLITDAGKAMDAIADKVLVNSVLIILASIGFITAFIPVIIIARDTIVDVIKMIAGNKGEMVAASSLGKWKTFTLMSGIFLVLIYNLPFELMGLNIAMFLLLIGTILSVVSGVEYYINNKKYIKKV